MSEIEYFYSAHSAYAYLGSRRFMEIAAAAGRPIRHRPFDLRRSIPEVGSMPIGQRRRNHLKYFFGREIDRWAEERDAPVMGGIPTHHANDVTLVNCLVIAAVESGISADRLAHQLLAAHWRDDADLDDAPTLVTLAAEVGIKAEPLLAKAATPEIRAIYDGNTEEAIRRSVFGSPTYFVDGDMFYGQDRLELVERALQRPYAPSPG